MELEGRVAIVTGAGTGIGLAIARRFAAEGAAVAITGRRQQLLEQAADVIADGAAGDGAVLVVSGDMSLEADVERLFGTVQKSFGRLDILVNNAAIAGEVNSIWDLSVEGWNEALAINLTGPWLCTRAAARIMMPQRSGKVVNIGSISGKRPLATRTPYTATKMGLLGLTKTCALELGPHNINVNLISPGAVDTPRLAELAEKWNRPLQEMKDTVAAGAALGRISTPDDIANTALFLASDQSQNITGIDITVDGGSCFI
jgi:NAD(P)-dependent dehydrogenase (short-subunit alcohol dehydrogenase family)